MRPTDFESKQAKVTLSFTVEDGSDPAPVVAKVFDMAQAEVHRRLGLRPMGQEDAYGKPGFEVAAEAHGITNPVFNPVKEATKRRAKAPPAEVPAENPTSYVGTVNLSTETVTTVGSDDPAAIGDFEVVPPIITDRQLRDAVVYAIGEKKIRNRAITDLIIEFTNPPGTPEGERVPGKNIPMIEQDRRGGFLDRLKALYADA
jgi:hypothetical protein